MASSFSTKRTSLTPCPVLAQKVRPSPFQSPAERMIRLIMLINDPHHSPGINLYRTCAA